MDAAIHPSRNLTNSDLNTITIGDHAHYKSDTHRWYATAIALGGQGVSQLMQHFDAGQRGPVAQQAAPGKCVDPGGRKTLPVAHRMF